MIPIHAIVRAEERYGLILTPADLLACERQIRAGYAQLVARLNPRGEVWLVEHQGVVMRAIYNPTLLQISTFLPRTGRPQTCRRKRSPRDFREIAA